MPTFNDPFANLNPSLEELGGEDLFDVEEDDPEVEEETGNEDHDVTPEGDTVPAPPETNEENEEEDFVPTITEPVETEVVNMVETDPAAAEAGEAVAKVSDDIESLGQQRVAVETYRGIVKHYGLTGGVGEAIRLGLESIHPSFGRTNCIPSMESIESGETGVVGAAERSLENTSKSIERAQECAFDKLEETLKAQAESTKAFAVESNEKLDQLSTRLSSIDPEATAIINVKNSYYIKADDVVVAMDARYQDMVEDTLKDVYGNVLKKTPELIRGVASVLSDLKGFENLDQLGEALVKVGKDYPSIEGRRGTAVCKLDYEVPAISTNTLIGEAHIVQYRSETAKGNTFRDLLNSFRYTYLTQLHTAEVTAESDVDSVNVPTATEINQLIEYLGKSLVHLERLVDITLVDTILQEANRSMHSHDLGEVECAQYAEFINTIVTDTTSLIGDLGAHATRVVSSSIQFITECVTALEEATARNKAEDAQNEE